MPPGTQAALWLRSYEDLFRYPATELNPGFLLQAGLKEIISTRLSALWTNVQRVIAENGLVFLLPVMLGGIVDRWKLRIVRAAVLYWATLLVVMSIVFPFAGAQGGMFHSSAALMPTLWILAPFGLRRIVAWIGVRRRWIISQATVNFGWILVFLSAIFTLGVYAQRVYGLNESGRSWGSDFKIYESLGQKLTALRPEAEMVMVNNPPGFYGATGIKAIVVPSGGAESLKQALEDYNADYLVLDRNYPTGLGEIYERDQVPDWLVFRDEVNLGPAGPQLIFQAHLDSDG
jgi:hypothetical protein